MPEETKTLKQKIVNRLKYYFRYIYSSQVKFVFDPDYLKKYVSYNWPLPKRYRLCNYNYTVDLAEWARLLNEDGHFGFWDADKVQKEIVDHLCAPDTATFLYHNDRLIGCCAAVDNSTPKRKIMCGMYLFLRKKYSTNRTFARALTLNTAAFSIKYHYDEASGYTDTNRLSAICLYLLNGASPVIVALSDIWYWWRIKKRLRPILNRYYSRVDKDKKSIETLIDEATEIQLYQHEKDQIVRYMDNSSPLKFYGSFEAFQNDKFVEVFKKYNKWKLLNIDGMKIFMGHSKIIGHTEGILGSPDIFGHYDTWWPKVKDLNCTYLTVHTLEDIPQLSKYCITKPDNVNLFIDLSLGEERLFDKFEHRCRKAIRAGIKKGVTVRHYNGEDDLRCFYNLVLEMSDSGKKYDILEYDLVKELLEQDCAALLVGIADNKVIGGLFMVFSDTNISGWLGALDRDYTKLTPGNVMMFEGMKWAIKRNFKFFDFGQQSLMGNRPQILYKMSFNPLIRLAYSYKIPMNSYKIAISNIKNNVFRH